MGLFWQIVVFLIVTAALGFVLGWVLRGVRLEGAREELPRPSDAEADLADQRDRLRSELQAAHDGHAEVAAALAESQQLAEARARRVRELEGAEAGSRQRVADLEDELSRAKAAAASPRPDVASLAAAAPTEARPMRNLAAAPAAAFAGSPPHGIAAPDGEPDDLQQISGIGPGIERILHDLGIYHFRQIAAFTSDNVLWLDQRLRFKGRIEREDWIGQARKLAAGETLDRA